MNTMKPMGARVFQVDNASETRNCKFSQSFGYLIESFGFIFIPGYKVILSRIVFLSAAFGEVTLAIWLLVKGTKQNRTNDNIATYAGSSFL